MLNATPIARLFIEPDARRMDAWIGRIEQIQRRVLASLMDSGSRTHYGHRHGMTRGMTYEEFAANVPLTHYEEMREWVMRMVKGERDVLWPGKTVDFAQSSGTSDGKSKFIPITARGLRENHMAGARAAVACYLRNNPRSRLFSGRSFILGGSFANTLDIELPKGTRAGDLSATLIAKVPRIIELFYRVPPRNIALMADWEQKLPALVKAASACNVTNISGVPSWFMAVLEAILDYTGKENIKQVWPNLEVFFHGGISFAPYREQYRQLMGGEAADITYVETYNASEGFFAVCDTPATQAMRLLIEQGVFYEFLEPGADHPVPAWEVEPGKIYEMFVTTCNGLWRYSPGDTVIAESTDPLRIRIAGRTKHYINAFGEEVMVYNADNALRRACDTTGAKVLNYTAAPLFAHDRDKGRHQWLVEFAVLPASLEKFAEELDKALREENSDYDAKRSHSLFLQMPLVTVADRGLFDRWLASTGKLGGQRKVPRLANNRELISTLLEMNGRD